MVYTVGAQQTKLCVGYDNSSMHIHTNVRTVFTCSLLLQKATYEDGDNDSVFECSDIMSDQVHAWTDIGQDKSDMETFCSLRSQSFQFFSSTEHISCIA